MREALALARRGRWRTSPNPAVGAVVVRRGRVVAGGYHRKAGSAHAEVEALGAAGSRASGATLYVTLEPCCTYGRTPPCTDAIIRSGIERVVIGSLDPNPGVDGAGARRLAKAGIKVETGVLGAECSALNETYAKYITSGLPFVTLKLATSLDGRIATHSGESRWITGPEARRFVHRLRSRSDAVMVGSGTVSKDDPELTVRRVRGRDPVRVVLDSRLDVPPGAKVFDHGPGGRGPIVFTTRAAPRARREALRSAGVRVVDVPAASGGLDLRRALCELGRLGVTTLLVEGGGRLAASLLKAGLVDKVIVFLAPIFIGGDGVPAVGGLGGAGLAELPRLTRTSVRRFGEDIMVEGYTEIAGQGTARGRGV